MGGGQGWEKNLETDAVIVNFVCQLDWVMVYLDIWLNIIEGVFVIVFITRNSNKHRKNDNGNLRSLLTLVPGHDLTVSYVRLTFASVD